MFNWVIFVMQPIRSFAERVPTLCESLSGLFKGSAREVLVNLAVVSQHPSLLLPALLAFTSSVTELVKGNERPVFSSLFHRLVC